MTHELIDREQPQCLYCGVEFDLNAMSINSSSTYHLSANISKIDSEILYCTDCQEVFSILSKQYNDGETVYTGFNFTCKDYSVFVNYIESHFDISTHTEEYIATIPIFELDFSDRNKLHEKIKTYILFS